MVEPDLLNIFTKIVSEKKQFCFLCLRTCDERRLVKPASFKKFMDAVKIKSNGNAHLVCHICEHQAAKALRLFRAAVFASSLSRILAEMCRRNISCNKIMDEKYFKRVVGKVDLSKNKNLSPQTVSREVKIIRKNTLLSETETLVMDNTQVYESVSAPTVVAIITGQAETNNTEVFQEAVIQCPIPSSPPSILPDRDDTQEDVIDVERNKNNKSPEAYIILDDEEDPLQIEDDPNIDNTPQQTTPPPNRITSILNENLVITLDPPTLIRFDELLTQQNEESSSFLLHPIILSSENDLSVPSLSAVIINDVLVYHNALQHVIHSRHLNVNMDIVKRYLKSRREVYIQHFCNFKLPTHDSNDSIDSCQSEFSNYPQKKIKIDDFKTSMSCSSSLKKNSVIKEVQISDISSDMDESPRLSKTDGKTDWEDKIPMDVISFAWTLPNETLTCPGCSGFLTSSAEDGPPSSTESTPRFSAEGAPRSSAEGAPRSTAEGAPRSSAEGAPPSSAEGGLPSSAEDAPPEVGQSDGAAHRRQQGGLRLAYSHYYNTVSY